MQWQALLFPLAVLAIWNMLALDGGSEPMQGLALVPCSGIISSSTQWQALLSPLVVLAVWNVLALDGGSEPMQGLDFVPCSGIVSSSTQWQAVLSYWRCWPSGMCLPR